jgi:hypothetical protein
LTPNASESERLKEQLQIVRDRGKHHGDVMAFFYVNYYIAIVMVMNGRVARRHNPLLHCARGMDGNIALGFDITKVSYDDAFQTSRPTPSPAASPPADQNRTSTSR